MLNIVKIHPSIYLFIMCECSTLLKATRVYTFLLCVNAQHCWNPPEYIPLYYVWMLNIVKIHPSIYLFIMCECSTLLKSTRVHTSLLCVNVQHCWNPPEYIPLYYVWMLNIVKIHPSIYLFIMCECSTLLKSARVYTSLLCVNAQHC